MQRASRIPLLVAGDFERGDSMRVDSKTLFPHAMAFAATGDPELSRAEGAVTARQGVALGVPWILAPVADVNNNPDNPIINIRSYGENPDEVAAHVRAFIEGAARPWNRVWSPSSTFPDTATPPSTPTWRSPSTTPRANGSTASSSCPSAPPSPPASIPS